MDIQVGHAIMVDTSDPNHESWSWEAEFYVIAIGDPSARQKAFLQRPHLKYISFRASTALVQSSSIGVGAILCPYSVVTRDVEIGTHCQLNIGVTVGHDCRIGDFFTAAPGARISGNVIIGNRVYVGSNAVIKEKVTICDDVTIGAGAVVVKDIIEPGTYVGIPAKKISA